MDINKTEAIIHPELYTIGKTIRVCRQAKYMTMRELGLLSGFTPKTADVRIAQYEVDRAVPTLDIRKRIASNLDISELAISPMSVDTELQTVHTLMRMDSVYDLNILRCGDTRLIMFPLRYKLIWHYLDELMKLKKSLLDCKISREQYIAAKCAFGTDTENNIHPADCSGNCELCPYRHSCIRM